MPRPDFPPLCMMCERWVPGILDPDGIQRCEAFPNGIPTEIFEEYFNHTEPFAPTNTILFKPRPGITQEDVDKWESEYTRRFLVEPLAERFPPEEDDEEED